MILNFKSSNDVNTFIAALLLVFFSFSSSYIFPTFVKSIIMLIGALLILFAYRHRGKLKFSLHKLEVILILALIFLTLQSLILNHKVFSVSSIAIHLFTAYLFFIGLKFGRKKVNIINSNYKPNNLLLLIIVVCLFFMLIMFYTEFFINASSSRSFYLDSLNPVGVAYSINIGMIIVLLLIFKSNSVVFSTLTIVLFFLCLVLSFKTGSRGAQLSLLLTLAIIVFSKLSQMRKIKTKVIIMSAIYLIGALTIAFVFKDRLYEASELLINRFMSMAGFFNGGGEDLSISAREDTWSYYIDNINLYVLTGMPDYIGYPHNQFIEWVARFGVIGIIISIASIGMLFFSIYTVYLSCKFDDFELLIIGAVFMFGFFQSLTSLALEMNKTMFLGFGYYSGILINKNFNIFNSKNYANLGCG